MKYKRLKKKKQRRMKSRRLKKTTTHSISQLKNYTVSHGMGFFGFFVRF